MTTTPHPIADLDVPLADIEQQTTACQVLTEAAAHTDSPAERLAYTLGCYLVTHPEACSHDAGYPGWTEHIAALTKLNRAKGNR